MANFFFPQHHIHEQIFNSFPIICIPFLFNWIGSKFKSIESNSIELNLPFIVFFSMESQAYKICEGWATSEGNAAFPTKCNEKKHLPTD